MSERFCGACQWTTGFEENNSTFCRFLLQPSGSFEDANFQAVLGVDMRAADGSDRACLKASLVSSRRASRALCAKPVHYAVYCLLHVRIDVTGADCPPTRFLGCGARGRSR